MQEQWELLKDFSIPKPLMESVAYLQRALRDCVLQHQILASKINILAIPQRPKAKQFLLELEREILSIGKEQEGVVRQLSERVKRFQMTVQSQRKIALEDDIVCGYVSQQITATQTEAENNVQSVPKHISPRWSAAELAKKYSLEALLETSVVVKEESELPDVEREDSNHTENAQWTPMVSSETKKKNSHSKALKKTYLQSTSRPSLRARAQSTATTEERPFAGIADQKPTISTVKREEQEDDEGVEDEEEDSLPTPEKSSEDEPKSDGKPQPQPARVGVWMPGLRGRPPRGSMYVAASKQPPVVVRRMSMSQQQQPTVFSRRVSKRKEVLSEKMQEPYEPDEGSADEEEPPTQLLNSAAVRRGRSNLLQALNRQKRGPGRPSLDSMAGVQQKTCPKRAPLPGGSKLVKHASYASSGSSPNSRSSTPTWGSGPQPSEDSSDRRSSSTELPPLPDPGEASEPAPTSIYQIGQLGYLRYLQLCTPEEVKAAKERKQERKRRSCYSTERKDFHYGKLDYYEQQQQYQAGRTSKRTHQRPILYSPPVVVAKKRKQPPVPQTATTAAAPLQQSSARRSVGSSSNSSRRRLQSADIFAAMDKRTCFVCFKSGTTDELGACMNCCNIYHLNCHTIDERSDAYRQRDDLCPVCLIPDNGDI